MHTNWQSKEAYQLPVNRHCAEMRVGCNGLTSSLQCFLGVGAIALQCQRIHAGAQCDNTQVCRACPTGFVKLARGLSWSLYLSSDVVLLCPGVGSASVGYCRACPTGFVKLARGL